MFILQLAMLHLELAILNLELSIYTKFSTGSLKVRLGIFQFGIANTKTIVLPRLTLSESRYLIYYYLHPELPSLTLYSDSQRLI